MKQFFVLFYLIIIFSFPILGQISPKNGAVLNYTQVLFEYPAQPNADLYILKVWKSSIASDERQDTLIQKDSSTVTIVKRLAWASAYNWSYIAQNKGATIYSSPVFQFSTDKILTANRKDGKTDAGIEYIVRKNIRFQGYVLNDLSKQMINPNGDMQWFIPESKMPRAKMINIRDLRMTDAGTFTCITDDKKGYEFDLDGNILWETPKDLCCPKDSDYYYHHDFRRLRNGNYMILNEDKQKTEIKNIDTIEWAKKENVKILNGKAYTEVKYGSIIEFDPAGKVVWQWNVADFFIEQAKKGRKLSEPHLNAFYLDKNEEDVYLGFKNHSLILKINKKTNKVSDYFYGGEVKGEPLFRFQHSIEKTKDGNLIIFNNDSIQAENIFSSVMFISDKERGDWKKVQSFSCKIDSLDNGKSARFGSAEVLPNGNILIGMGGQSRMVVINPNQKNEIVWDMHLQTTNSAALFYRSHFAQSLYPCYFSVEKQADFVKITNEGEMPDSYTIYFKGKNGKNLQISTSPIFEPNQSYNITLKKNIKEIEVISNTNNRLIRKISL